jgi:hypothetical protein
MGGLPAGLAVGLALVLRFAVITRRSPQPKCLGHWFPRSSVSPDGGLGSEGHGHHTDRLRTVFSFFAGGFLQVARHALTND